MSDAKHTPADWHLHKLALLDKHSYREGFVFSIEDDDGNCLALLEDCGERTVANGLVLAAAQRLLAACIEALIAVDEAYQATGFFKVAKTSEQRMRIEAAIAQATGTGDSDTTTTAGDQP